VKYVELAGRKVSAIGLGLWQFGSAEWGWGRDFGEEDAGAIVQRALDLGITFFDTAELYGRGRSEEILGRALAGRRDEAFIATKVSPVHLTRGAVVEAAERSLERIGTERIDLYQVHWPNRFVPLKQTMRGMLSLLEAGKIGSAGVSNFPLPLWRKADRALGRDLVANQVQFHLLDQPPLDELVPFAQANQRTVIAYSPLAQGVLGGRYDAGNLPRDFRASNPSFSSASFAAVAPLLEELRSVAGARNVTPAQIALAWLLRIPNVIAIPGARTVDQVEANAAAADIELGAEEWTRLRDAGRRVRPPKSRPLLKRLAAWLLGA